MLKYEIKIKEMVDDVGKPFYVIGKMYFGLSFMFSPIYISQGGALVMPVFDSYKEARAFKEENKCL